MLVGLDFFRGECFRKQSFELRCVCARSFVGVTECFDGAGALSLTFLGGACRFAAEAEDCGICFGRSAKEARLDLMVTAELRCLASKGRGAIGGGRCVGRCGAVERLNAHLLLRGWSSRM